MKDIIAKLREGFFNPESRIEQCGLVLKPDTIIESENIHPEPERGFEIDPKLLVDFEPVLIASWHTHLDGTANLSEEDYRGFGQWPELKHIILTKDDARVFEVDDDGFVVEVECV